MQVLERRSELDALGATAVAVGFSPPDALAALAEHLGWPFPFLSDPERSVFRRLGFPVATRARVWTEGTKALYRRAAAEGRSVPKPVEDTDQLGGDAILVAGTAVRVFRTASPDDRVSVDDLFAALRDAAAGPSEPGAGTET